MESKQHDIGISIESGEYYRDALRWYSTLYNGPIAERVLLIIIAVMAAVVTMMTVVSMFMLMPVVETRTMIVHLPQSLDRVARVQPLVETPNKDINPAILDWFLSNYVTVREGYDIDRQERYNYRVWALSAPDVYAGYVGLYKSADSPTVRYERHTKRLIEIKDITITDSDNVGKLDGNPGDSLMGKARIQFVATELTSSGERKSAWNADISFRFDKINVDQMTGELSPLDADEKTGKTVYKGFMVTGYQSKQMGL